MLRKLPITCSGCPLACQGARGFTDPDGKGTLGVLIVSEASGAAEANDSLPFRPYAQAGAVLDRCIRKAGYDRSQFGITNLTRCQPPNNWLDGAPWEVGAIQHCTPNFSAALEQFRPKVILALGGVPLRHLTGMAGKKRGISLLRGFAIPGIGHGGDRGRVPVVASYHPSFIARGASKLIPVLIRDIQFAVEVAKNGITYETPTYTEHPTSKDATEFLDRIRRDPSTPIAYDIETDYSTKVADEDEAEVGGAITQIQFSLAPGSAIVCPWTLRYKEFTEKVLGSPNPKWGWNNWGFDDKILEANDVKISGPNHDLMRAWGHLQPDLPKGLQYATSFYAPSLPPWKHLSDSEAEFYGGLDVDSVQRIGSRIFLDLESAGIANGYARQVFDLYPILKRMSERGLPVDEERRLAFRKEIEASRKRVGHEIQSLVPTSLKPIHPPAGYKVAPPPIREMLREFGVKFAPKEKKHYPEEAKTKGTLLGFKCATFDGEERFYLEKPFLATSADQVLAYIKAKGHRVPLGLKTKKETTDKKNLARLYAKTGDPAYLKFIEYREFNKVITTYIDGWNLDSEGRVHSTILPGPATGQLQSRDPNIQNIPKRGDLAKSFRRCIVPQKGHTLVAFDFVGFHSLMVGYLARDPEFMLLSRLGIHDYLVGHMLKLPKVEEWLSWSIDDLAKVLAETKLRFPEVRAKAKNGVHGYNFGMKAKRLYEENLETFDHQKEAQAILDKLDFLFPLESKWREETKELAARQTYLRSPHGYIRRFYDIYHHREVDLATYEPRPGERLFTRHGKTYKRVSGEEAEDAIAFGPANCAFGHAKDKIIECDELDYNDKYRFVNQIHDESLFECPIKLVDECIASVSEVMESASRVLVDPILAPSGLRVGIEASVGEDWSKMEKVYGTSLSKLL